jgi:hypothetical protein
VFDVHSVVDALRPRGLLGMAACWRSLTRRPDVRSPARVDGTGQALTAEFSAPSAGPPPWFVYRLTPLTATAVATVEPGGVRRLGQTLVESGCDSDPVEEGQPIDVGEALCFHNGETLQTSGTHRSGRSGFVRRRRGPRTSIRIGTSTCRLAFRSSSSSCRNTSRFTPPLQFGGCSGAGPARFRARQSHPPDRIRRSHRMDW